MSLSESEERRTDIVTQALRRSMERRDGLIERLPIGVCVCDLAGRLIQYNERAAEIWGYAPPLGDQIGRVEGALDASDQRGAPLTEENAPITRALRTGEPVKDMEINLKRNGEDITILANADPLFDDLGHVVGVVKCFLDISAKKATEERLRQGARAVSSIINALPAAIYTTDPEGRITFFNKSAVEVWGRKPVLGEERFCGSHRIFLGDGTEIGLDECPMAQSLKQGVPIRNVEVIVERPDGTRTPALPFPTPIFNDSGVLLGAVNMLVDITERKKFDERQKVLIDELNHRVKNTLATVQAMALQTFRGADLPREDVEAFLARLMALSKTHDHLTREQWESADLSGLAEDILRPLNDGATERMSIEGDPTKLSPRAALTLGLVLNELATNAAKYGALSDPNGKLRVYWYTQDDEFVLSWRESGGPHVAPVRKRGFGTRMIERSIESQLDGQAQLRFAPEGFECDLRIPRKALA